MIAIVKYKIKYDIKKEERNTTHISNIFINAKKMNLKDVDFINEDLFNSWSEARKSMKNVEAKSALELLKK